MQSRSATVYFDNVQDARHAQAALQAFGISAELSTNSSDPAAAENGGFIARIREYFGATPAPAEYSRGALLTVSNANEEAISIIRAYRGRMNSTKDSHASA